MGLITIERTGNGSVCSTEYLVREDGRELCHLWSAALSSATVAEEDAAALAKANAEYEAMQALVPMFGRRVFVVVGQFGQICFGGLLERSGLKLALYFGGGLELQFWPSQIRKVEGEMITLGEGK